HALEPVVSPLLAVAGLALVFCAVMAIVGLILRYRGSHGDERQQVRRLAYLGLATVAAFVLNLIANAVFGDQTTSQPARFILVSTADLFFATVVIGIPVACGVAILRYRLYDLDVVVRKTVVF